MLKGSIPIGRFFGISVRLHVSWFIIFVLVTWSLVVGYFPQAFPHWSTGMSVAAGVLASLLFFASVLAHELMHSIVAQKQGIPVQSITLFIFGGLAQIGEEPKTPQDEFRMAFAGPLTSLVIGLAFLGIWYFWKVAPELVRAVSFWLGWINIFLAGFNLIPGFPLDGGRVLRSVIWWRNNNLYRSTVIAANVGKVIGYLIIAAGIFIIFTGNWFNGLWLGLIGWFLLSAAEGSVRQMALQQMLRGHFAYEVMTRECAFIEPSMNVQQLVNDNILAEGRRCFPVVENNKALGLVTLHNIKVVPREMWNIKSVREIMTPIEQVKAVTPDTELYSVLKLILEENINQVLVLKDGNILGMITRENLLSFINIRGELGI